MNEKTPLPRSYRAAAFVKAHPTLRALLVLLSLAAVLIFAWWYVFLLSLHFEFSDTKTRFILTLALPAAAFAAVSVYRAKKNAPRPIDREPFSQFYSEEERNRPFFRLVYHRAGKSFPSRHVFSAALIAALYLPLVPLLSLALFGVAAVLGAARVLLALHSIRDVLFGALFGAVAGGAIGVLVCVIL